MILAISCGDYCNFLVYNSYKIIKNKSKKNGLILVQNHDLNNFESTVPRDDYT